MSRETQQKHDCFAKQKFWPCIENLFQKILGINKWQKKFIKLASGNVLDVAVGMGTNFKYYAKNCHVFAIDISWEMLKIAQKTKPTSLKVNFLLADAENLPFVANSFNNVISIFSLCTVDKPVQVVNEMQRVCQANGQLIFLEHGQSKSKIIQEWQNARVKKHSQRLNCHNNRNIIQIIKKGGIKNFLIQRKWLGIFYLIKSK